MDLKKMFTGMWQLTRELRDERANVTARFAGRLDVGADDHGLWLEEQGQWQGAPWGDLPARRVDFWRGQDSVQVLFEDGRFFHDLTPVMQGAEDVEHLCGDDLYQGSYRFDLPNRWQVTWRVRGPRKHYDTVTVFSRGA